MMFSGKSFGTTLGSGETSPEKEEEMEEEIF